MSRNLITEELVASNTNVLPAFPKTVQRILETVDDPDSSMAVLADAVAHDPAIAGRVLAVANMAASLSRRRDTVEDIYAATAMVGMQQVREIALLFSLSGFVRAMADGRGKDDIWRHSVSVGVCAQELVLQVRPQVSSSHALIAGLLHDIGQFWLLSFMPDVYPGFWKEAINSGVEITKMEEAAFGVDHARIGAWLTQAWRLPPEISRAIAGHHAPDQGDPANPLVALVHVAEVLSNALELGDGSTARVNYLSSRACELLGLVWNDASQPLFGRIDARSRYVNNFFSS